MRRQMVILNWSLGWALMLGFMIVCLVAAEFGAHMCQYLMVPVRPCVQVHTLLHMLSDPSQLSIVN